MTREERTKSRFAFTLLLCARVVLGFWTNRGILDFSLPSLTTPQPYVAEKMEWRKYNLRNKRKDNKDVLKRIFTTDLDKPAIKKTNFLWWLWPKTTIKSEIFDYFLKKIYKKHVFYDDLKPSKIIEHSLL